MPFLSLYLECRAHLVKTNDAFSWLDVKFQAYYMQNTTIFAEKCKELCSAKVPYNFPQKYYYSWFCEYFKT